MKLTSLFKSVEKETIKLRENQLFSVKGKNIQIKCLYGVLWITWPHKTERILKSGQTLRVSSRGKICVVALSNAYFEMSKKNGLPIQNPLKNREQKTSMQMQSVLDIFILKQSILFC